MKTQEIGKNGEDSAVAYLENLQYVIIERNWRYKRCEIDIIAKQNTILVFVEVKSRKNNMYGFPEEFVSTSKIDKMQEAASAYIEQHNWQGELRFDIIALENNHKIKHFEDAFY